jgi:hypothetical protein
LRTGLKNARDYAKFMKIPSIVSIKLMPAVKRIGRQRIA